MAPPARPVLIVEDDDDIRETVASILGDEGYEIVAAANGSEALAKLQEMSSRPCLILLDLMMPVMNAWGFRKELLQDEGLAAIPIVLLSGNAHVVDRASDLGARAALVKPISLAKLLEVVGRFATSSH